MVTIHSRRFSFECRNTGVALPSGRDAIGRLAAGFCAACGRRSRHLLHQHAHVHSAWQLLQPDLGSGHGERILPANSPSFKALNALMFTALGSFFQQDIRPRQGERTSNGSDIATLEAPARRGRQGCQSNWLTGRMAVHWCALLLISDEGKSSKRNWTVRRAASV